ncbi:microfibril-associated glycoprotein 4-like isoform X1 [Saccostrea cucullata]|uniref:microfibril-associated glycoprotein 4-like isoform X1 n=1 Tax=Saccostrea cuccullata TaxID=36930 RepID=UPI002ED51721
MKKSQFTILTYLFISLTFGYVLSIGNDSKKENKLFRSPTSGKPFNILREILTQESSLRSSMVQKIQNLVRDATAKKNITKLLWEKLGYLGNKVNDLQLKNLRLEETLNESLEDFNQDQNKTSTRLQSIPPLPQSKMSCFLPFDCYDIYNCGERKTGVYEIYPISRFISTPVLCDMESKGGGWTVIQRRNRESPYVNFNAAWDEYKRGFGDVPGMYWLGNEVIHQLTTTYKNSLYIRLKSTKNESFEVQYSSFSISNDSDDYRLSLGEKSGNIADAFRSYNIVGFPFYTFDRDNKHKCASRHGSGWWFDYCYHVNLNAPLLKTTEVMRGIISQGRYLFHSEMLIRRSIT